MDVTLPRVTMKDIAAAARVSTMTVSNVVNGRAAKASTETIERINAAIRTLGYTPNMSARALVSSSSKMIGVIIPFTEDRNQLLLDNPFYAEMVSGIESALRAQGYYMMLSGVGEAGARLDTLSHWSVDGLIVLGVYREALYDRLRELDLPTLMIDSYIDEPAFYRLGIDDEQAAYEATRYLIGKDHREVALVTGVIRSGGVVERRHAGYARALRDAGIGYDAARVFAQSVTFEWGAEAAEAVARAATAAFCTADLIAAGLVAGLHKTGKRVPDDVSVMGFDNLSVARLVYPALTTVDQGILEKGRLAGNLAVAMLGKDKPSRDTVMPVRIVERDSVGSPR